MWLASARRRGSTDRPTSDHDLSPGCQGCQNCQALSGVVRCCQGHCHMTATAAVKLLSGCCQAAVRA
eukprot:2867939-Prymnesium_polylepis.1